MFSTVKLVIAGGYDPQVQENVEYKQVRANVIVAITRMTQKVAAMLCAGAHPHADCVPFSVCSATTPAR